MGIAPLPRLVYPFAGFDRHHKFVGPWAQAPSARSPIERLTLDTRVHAPVSAVFALHVAIAHIPRRETSILGRPPP